MKRKPVSEQKFMYALAGLVFLFGLGLLAWFVWQYFVTANFSNSEVDVANTKNEQVKKCDFRRMLDGVCVDSVEKTNPKLVAVMIENHTEARPQFGLSDASIVYEAPVEANYTRFLAIYPEDVLVAKVGPVRSARPYYLDWLAEYGNPMYMHCGGSPEALKKIVSTGVFDFNEMYRGQYFWRDNARLAPHNLFTSSELWGKVTMDDGLWTMGPSDWWMFEYSGKLMVDSGTTSTNDINVSFLAPSYVVDWKYNSSTQKYERWQAGREHRDAVGTLITADTVIVQHVKYKVLDDIGRIFIETIGTGSVEVYFNGEKISGTWKKIDRISRTRFYSELGEEIKLKAGRVWIEVINK